MNGAEPVADAAQRIYGGLSLANTTAATAVASDLLAPGHAKPGYLAFLGRIAPEKSVDRAIRIAVEAGLPLKIAAKVDRVSDPSVRVDAEEHPRAGLRPRGARRSWRQFH